MSKKPDTQYFHRSVEDAPLNPPPDFYDNLAGNPYQSRVDQLKDTTQVLSTIQKTLYLPIEIFDPGVGFETVNHNLGYKPFVVGMYKIITSNSNLHPVGRISTIPDRRRPDFFTSVPEAINIDTIDEKKVGVRVSWAAPGIVAVIMCKLLLFRELAP